MKKIITVSVLVMMIVSMLSVSAFAASLNEDEQRIYDAITEEITVAGKPVALADEWVNQAKNYMLRDDVDLTKAQADEILAYIDEAKAVAKTSKTVSNGKFSTKVNNELFLLANECGALLDISFSHPGLDNARKIVAVDNKSGDVIYKAAKVIKDTGANVNVMPVAIAAVVIMTVIGSAVLVKKFEL